MKIRTSFVTNSSGSSFTEITIENPVLANIIQKYNTKFEKAGKIKMNNSKTKIRNNRIIMSDSGHPACCGEDFFWKGFNDVKDGHIEDSIVNSYLDKIENDIKILNYCKEIEAIFSEIKKEMDERRKQINSSFKTISYHDDYSGDLGGCGSTVNEIVCDFSNKCPKCGEPLLYDKYNSNYDYIDKNGHYHYDIAQITDTIQIYCINKKCNYSKVILSQNYLLKNQEEYDNKLPF